MLVVWTDGRTGGRTAGNGPSTLIVHWDQSEAIFKPHVLYLSFAAVDGWQMG